MSQDESIKIRTLPRKNEKKESPKKEAKPAAAPRTVLYIAVISAILLAAVLFFDRPTETKKQAAAAVQKTELASVAKRQNASVSRHMQESQKHHQLMVQAQQLENLKVKTKNLEADAYALDSTRTYGVQLDQEDVSDRIYDDLNLNNKNYGDATPDEKISARLANRRWVNELERRERITFVRNFIKSAYERGYEVDIDQNLVVVGVRKRSDTQKLNIEQIMDKFAAKQGY